MKILHPLQTEAGIKKALVAYIKNMYLEIETWQLRDVVSIIIYNERERKRLTLENCKKAFLKYWFNYFHRGY